jgi:hypothetical protein
LAALNAKPLETGGLIHVKVDMELDDIVKVGDSSLR